jgi:hypothetical protein
MAGNCLIFYYQYYHGNFRDGKSTSIIQRLNKLAQALIRLASISEVNSLNNGHYTGYPDSGFSCVAQSHQMNAGILPWNRSELLPPESFHVHKHEYPITFL